MDIGILYIVAFIFLALLLLKIIQSYFTSSRTKPSSAFHLPPGPWQLPLIGSLHHLLLSRFSDLPHRALREMSKTYGPLMMFRFGSVPTLVVSSAEAASEVFRTHDLAFCSRNLSVTFETLSCGGKDMIFSPYNAHWRELRKLCMIELFSQRRVLTFRSIREEEVAHLLCSISRSLRPIDLSEAILRMQNDLTARTVVGDRCMRWTKWCGYLVGSTWRTCTRPHGWFSTAGRDARRCQRNMYRIIQTIIHEREAMPMPERDEDLLGVLLRLQREGDLPFTLTNETVSAVIWDIFSAGGEATSTVLVWVMSELMKNPQLMHKAQLEVRETFKGQEKISEDDLVKLRYLPLVIKETLRLHTPVPLLPRECRESCQVMGYDVPKGTKVLVNVWAIARERKLWHDAKEFRPERFERSSIDFRGNDSKFTPFGAGRRICPGITMGLANLELALASLLYHFNWDLPDGIRLEEFDMAATYGIMLRKKSMLSLKARPYNFIPN